MSDRNGRDTSWLGIMATFLGLTLVGTPMLAYIWETLNRLLSGVLEPMRLVWTLLLGGALWLLLRWAGRLMSGWQTEGEWKGGES